MTLSMQTMIVYGLRDLCWTTSSEEVQNWQFLLGYQHWMKTLALQRQEREQRRTLPTNLISMASGSMLLSVTSTATLAQCLIIGLVMEPEWKGFMTTIDHSNN